MMNCFAFIKKKKNGIKIKKSERITRGNTTLNKNKTRMEVKEEIRRKLYFIGNTQDTANIFSFFYKKSYSQSHKD